MPRSAGRALPAARHGCRGRRSWRWGSGGSRHLDACHSSGMAIGPSSKPPTMTTLPPGAPAAWRAAACRASTCRLRIRTRYRRRDHRSSPGSRLRGLERPTDDADRAQTARPRQRMGQGVDDHHLRPARLGQHQLAQPDRPAPMIATRSPIVRPGEMLAWSATHRCRAAKHRHSRRRRATGELVLAPDDIFGIGARDAGPAVDKGRGSDYIAGPGTIRSGRSPAPTRSAPGRPPSPDRPRPTSTTSPPVHGP